MLVSANRGLRDGGLRISRSPRIVVSESGFRESRSARIRSARIDGCRIAFEYSQPNYVSAHRGQRESRSPRIFSARIFGSTNRLLAHGQQIASLRSLRASRSLVIAVSTHSGQRESLVSCIQVDSSVSSK